MDDFIRREAAIETLSEFYHHKSEIQHIALREALNRVPAADVRPVVLCKDCRHRDPEDNKCDCGQLERVGCVFPVRDDYFCAHGEMRSW